MILLLTLAGGLGAAARFVLDGAVRTRWPSQFPWGILLVNVLGSFVLGFLTGSCSTARTRSGGSCSAWASAAVSRRSAPR